MQLRLEKFTPGEAASITAVKQETVHNWRRLGHLPKPIGHARYNLAQVLVMFVMGTLVSRGTAAEAATKIASEAARATYQSAIWNDRAYSPAAHAQAKADLGADAHRIDVLEHMAKAALRLAGIEDERHPNWLIIWADGSLELLYEGENADEEFFSNVDHSQPFAQGPIVVFCLGAIARMVIDLLPRPAFDLVEGAQQ